MPATFSFGQTYDIPVYFKSPTNCHVFEGFNVEPDLNIRNIAAVLAKLDTGDCEDELVSQEQTLRFTAASNGSYVFRFFSGFDEATNEQTYLEYVVQVLE